MDAILFWGNKQIQKSKNITITAQTPFTTVEVAEYAMVKKQVAETALNSCVQSTMCRGHRRQSNLSSHDWTGFPRKNLGLVIRTKPGL